MRFSVQQIVHRSFAILVFICALPASAAWPIADGEGRQLPSLAPLLEQVNPAVVNISTFATQTVSNPMLNDPFFRHFFNMPEGSQRQQKRRTQSAGSGVIVDAGEGTVITNYHVIEGADEIRISLADKRSFDAELIGSDPEVDIAVLRIIDADDLAELEMADSEGVRQGDFVIAIGNPFGLENTVTTGVVSALGRSGLGIEGYENFIQTDASINRGNSGGALVNLEGKLIGINTAIIGPAGGNVGIGLAIPSNMARHSVEQILEHGEVKRGQLGVVIQDMNDELVEAFELESNQRGVLITQVQSDSAAEEAGIEAGDIVVAVNGKRIDSSSQLRNAVGVRAIGDKLKLEILRDGKPRKITVRVGERVIASADGASEVHPNLEGATLADAEDMDGVEITQIEPGSAAQSEGLRVGDTIVSINRVRIANLQQLSEVAARNTGRLLLRVIRGNSAFYLVLR